jgi:hypothetical protein
MYSLRSAFALGLPPRRLRHAQQITIRFPVEYSPDVAQGKADVDFVKRIEASSRTHQGQLRPALPQGQRGAGDDAQRAEMTTLVPAAGPASRRRCSCSTAVRIPRLRDLRARQGRQGVRRKGLRRGRGQGRQGARPAAERLHHPGTRSKQLIAPKDYTGVKLRGVGKINRTR